MPPDHTVILLCVSLDSIEDYIQTASSNVESANQELAKANQYQVQWTALYYSVLHALHSLCSVLISSTWLSFFIVTQSQEA